MPPGIKQQIFQQSLTKGMATFVFETDRPHLNEAALLAGTNPEIEAAQKARTAAQRRRIPALHDPVLQRGVDLVTSIEVYEKQTGRAAVMNMSLHPLEERIRLPISEPSDCSPRRSPIRVWHTKNSGSNSIISVWNFSATRFCSSSSPSIFSRDMAKPGKVA